MRGPPSLLALSALRLLIFLCLLRSQSWSWHVRREGAVGDIVVHVDVHVVVVVWSFPVLYFLQHLLPVVAAIHRVVVAVGGLGVLLQNTLQL